MRSRVSAAFLLSIAAALTLGGTTLAHASLIESDPPDGGTIERTPHTLTATFDEELSADRSRIVVRDSLGIMVASGGVSDNDDTVMTVELPELPDGNYTARWTAVTPDDQAVERGSFSFAVQGPQATDTPRPTPEATRTPAASEPAEPGATPKPTDKPTQEPEATQEPATTAQPTLPPDISSPSSGNNDAMLAIILAGAGVAAVVGFIVWRGRTGQPG